MQREAYASWMPVILIMRGQKNGCKVLLLRFFVQDITYLMCLDVFGNGMLINCLADL